MTENVQVNQSAGGTGDRQAGRYLALMLGSFFVILGIFLAVGLWVDPYLYFWPRPAGRPSPHFEGFDREVHLNLIAHTAPRNLILGDSRAEHGLLAAHWRPGDNHAINGGYFKAQIPGMRDELDRALQKGPVETAIFDMSFETTRTMPAWVPGLRPDHVIQPDGKWRLSQFATLITLRALTDIITDYRHYLRGAVTLRPTGEVTDYVWQGSVQAHGGFAGAYANTLNQAADELREPENDYKQALSALRDLACAHGTRLQLVMPPLHVGQRAQIEQLGLHGEWQDWKRAVVAIAAEKPACHFEVWDFQRIDPLTTQSVPTGRPEAATPGTAFWDGVHFQTWVGDAILAQINRQQAKSPIGVRLTPQNLESELAADDSAFADYLRRVGQ